MNSKSVSRNNKSVLGLLAVLCLIGSGVTAVWAGECEDRIGTVKTDVGIVAVPTKTQDSLKAKLDGAVQKLEQSKNADAKQKLQDFKDAVLLMRDAARPKISNVDASRLLDGLGARNAYDDGVNGAIVCVGLLP